MQTRCRIGRWPNRSHHLVLAVIVTRLCVVRSENFDPNDLSRLYTTDPPDATTSPATTSVALPTTTTTSGPQLLSPAVINSELELGLVGELFDLLTHTSRIATIDKTVHHWGELFKPLAIKWKGLLFIRSQGVYIFQVNSLGAAELAVDKVPLIKTDIARTGQTSLSSKPVLLPAGYHDILLGYTEQDGQAGFQVSYIGPDTKHELRTVPPHSLLHRRGPCDLRPLPGTDNVACEGPRWALGSGESCQVRCSWGRFPNGVRGSSSLLQCYEGQLSQRKRCPDQNQASGLQG